MLFFKAKLSIFAWGLIFVNENRFRNTLECLGKSRIKYHFETFARVYKTVKNIRNICFRKLEGDNHFAEPKGIFYFSHSVTLQAMVSALGIWKDPEPLLASNFKTMAKRQWRTSLLAPFATNFIAVFYK